jgi:hypothetical protein
VRCWSLGTPFLLCSLFQRGAMPTSTCGSLVSFRIGPHIVSILGLIFVAVRSLAYGHAIWLGQFMLMLDKDITDIRRMLGDDTSAREAAVPDLRDKIDRHNMKAFIDLLGFGAVSLACLYNLFTWL